MNQKTSNIHVSSYIPSIDGLRAIAVLSVIVFHLNSGFLPGGFIGVDVFFVISGYVISRSLANNLAPSFGNFLLDFYKRRILRIFPALLFCLIVTSFFAKLFIPQGFWLSGSNNWTGLWAFFGVSNFYLVSNIDGYFSSRTPFNPYVHTWSLAVEEQFYIVFPLLFYIWLRLRRQRDERHRIVFAIMLAVAIVSLFWSVYETQRSHERAFYLLPSRYWELSAGAILYQFNTYRPNYFDKAGKWLNIIGLLTLSIGFVFASEKHFPFPWALFPVAGSMLLLAGLEGKEDSILNSFLASRGMAYIGRTSYSLYLWHWPVFVLFQWTVGLSSPLYWLLALALTFVLASISYNYIELGIRTNNFLSRQGSWKIVVAGISTTYLLFFSVNQLLNANHTRWMSLSVTNDNECLWHVEDRKCFHSIDAISTNRSLFIVGDSHAAAYELMGNIAANRLGARLYVHSFSGCPIAKLIESDSKSSVCAGSEKMMLDWLSSRARPGDIVFLASLRLPRLGDQWSGFDIHQVEIDAASESQLAKNTQALADAKILIRKLRANGFSVLIDAPKPVFKSPQFRCSDWFNKTNPICSGGFTIERDFLLKFREPIMVSLRNLNNDLGITIWDPFPILCEGTICSASDGTKPKFIDGDHLSAYGNRILADSFTKTLSEIWPQLPQTVKGIEHFE